MPLKPFSRPSVRTGLNLSFVAVGVATVVTSSPALANGIFRNGAGARAMALGGASVGLNNGPLESIAVNPAQLSLVETPTLQVGAVGGFVTGDFANVADPNGDLDEKFHALPDLAFALAVNDNLTLGIAALADAGASVDWHFIDAPNPGGVSYGNQLHRSEILVYRIAAGFSYEVTERFAFGGSVGLIYNKNALKAPYIFQSFAPLKGAKTLLDLETDGFGVNGNVGIQFRPTDTVTLGASYQTETHLDSDGRARGDAGAQVSPGTPFPFRYDAEVENVFPQMVTVGVSWQARSWLRAVAQVDWIDWSGSFDNLPIHLTHGTNGGLPAAFDDTVPLDWRDRFVFRGGLEFGVSEEVLLRLGYAHGDNPVPAGTLTPMTAAIAEDTLTVGVEWRRGGFSLAAAYQYDLPTSVTVGTSNLAAGEYSGSKTEVSLHWFGLTAGYSF